MDEFINKYNYKDKNLEEEIENIFNNILNETCYIYSNPQSFSQNLNGMGDLINLADFTFLVPNLFRVCYAQTNCSIPTICPTYISQTTNVNYFPKLINNDLIKSFLYFNFPGSIRDFNNNYNFIDDSIHPYNKLKKKSFNYGSYSNPANILLNSYSQNSLLIELITFNQYLTACYLSNNNNLIINNTNIKLDFIKSCVSYDNSTSYTIGNFKNNLTIDQSTGLNLYNIKNSLLYTYNNDKLIISNGVITLQDNSIFKVLDIVNDVFQDIVEEIQYYFENKIYCRKPYMYSYNIPVLIKIYKNYYINQLYTNEKNLVLTNPYNIIPVVINITDYVNSFIEIYYSSYPNRYLVKTIYLSSNIDALVIYNNIESWINVPNGSSISYWYYYINIENPSPVELYNINFLDTNTYTDLNTFTTTFNNSYMSNLYTISDTVLYTNYGLYPDAGYIDDTNIINCNAYVYYFTNKKGVLQSILFETLQSNTVINTSGYDPGDSGIPTSGIVLQYYSAKLV